MDSIKPGNGPQLVKLFHQTLETAEIEIIFFMLIRQLRLLLALSEKEETPESIDEIKKMAPWQKGKLHNQAAFFTQEQLLTLYQKLFVIEVGQKTGGLSSSLTSTIDFFLFEV